MAALLLLLLLVVLVILEEKQEGVLVLVVTATAAIVACCCLRQNGLPDGRWLRCLWRSSRAFMVSPLRLASMLLPQTMKWQTIFSAPHYCGEFDNAGGMMVVRDDLMCSFKVLKPKQ